MAKPIHLSSLRTTIGRRLRSSFSVALIAIAGAPTTARGADAPPAAPPAATAATEPSLLPPVPERPHGVVFNLHFAPPLDTAA